MIYKYGPFPVGKVFECPSEVIHFGAQNGDLFVWAQHGVLSTNAMITGTGYVIPVGFKPVSSCFDGPFVWHLLVKE